MGSNYNEDRRFVTTVTWLWMNSLVSVIIPAYNCGKYLKEAVDSVLNQTYKNVEIIIIDDGSTDDTQKVAEEFSKKVIYHRQPHRGAASARNEGIKRASGDFIAFLDADDVWLKEKVARQVMYFEKNPEVGLVYTDLYRLDAGSNRIISKWSDVFPVKEGFVFRDLIERNFIQTSAVMIKKKVVDEIGFFDEEFKAYEDIDYWVRVAEKFKIGYIPEPLVIYRMFPESLSKKGLWMAEGRLKVFKKHAHKIQDERWQKRVLADIYSEFMVAHYLNSNMKEARRYFYMAFSQDPKILLRGRTTETFLKTLLGKTIVNWLRSMKRWLKKRCISI